MTKRCSRCRQTKPTSEFHRGSGPDGLHRQCKVCRSTISSATRAEREGSLVERQALLGHGLRRCTACRAVKPVNAFYRSTRNSDGLKGQCIPCFNARREEYAKRPATRERRAERDRRFREERPEEYARRRREYAIRSKYGISSAQYDGMLSAQDSLCPICLRLPDGDNLLDVDHDHTTGRIRGLLHRRCNAGLGMFEDDPERLERAASYLRLAEGSDRPFTLGPHPFDRLDRQNVLS